MGRDGLENLSCWFCTTCLGKSGKPGKPGKQRNYEHTKHSHALNVPYCVITPSDKGSVYGSYTTGTDQTRGTQLLSARVTVLSFRPGWGGRPVSNPSER